MASASFREELLKSLNTKQFPKSIQRLIDSGIVQECEEIDGIYYLLFGFYLHNQSFPNFQLDVILYCLTFLLFVILNLFQNLNVIATLK